MMKGYEHRMKRDPEGETYKFTFVMNCDRVIATAQRSGGNETVGDMWDETRTFPPTATAQEIMDWAASVQISGKLTLTPDLATLIPVPKEEEPF